MSGLGQVVLGRYRVVAELKARIGQWRRATRWMLTIDQDQASAVAESVLRHLDDMQYYVPCGHPWLSRSDRAPRRPGRQRLRPTTKRYSECASCHGFGWV